MMIGITGMPGSGKDIVKEVLRELGFSIVVMGDEVRVEADRRNLPHTPENLGKIMIQLRKEEGEEVLAKRCLPKIRALQSQFVAIDGIRSLAEVSEFKKELPNLRIIAVHSSPKTRFERLLRRNRSDDPKDWSTFIKRDKRELSVGLGNVIATADLMIVNEGTLDSFKKEIRQLIQKEFQVWAKSEK
ncbi:flagellar hook-basal body complex protein FliE [Candidatus Bathyarchaeota archaeon]|nr:flagellar hook-basal body complex protein FliE [Candidatus Bathyarchaeota archaeon]